MHINVACALRVKLLRPYVFEFVDSNSTYGKLKQLSDSHERIYDNGDEKIQENLRDYDLKDQVKQDWASEGATASWPWPAGWVSPVFNDAFEIFILIALIEDIMSFGALKHDLVPVLSSCTSEQGYKCAEEVLKVAIFVQLWIYSWSFTQVQ